MDNALLSSPFLRALAWTALGLAVTVVLLGAYVRLSDAGLGCPDWPGCYGQPLVPESSTLYPERPLVAPKAWREMVHRYAAGTLGLLIGALFLLIWRDKRVSHLRPLAAALAVLVLFQALLGMWTVTLKLHPFVVLGHLLGGLAVTSLLFALAISLRPQPQRVVVESPASLWSRFVLLVVAAQITLGGWTSTNYAAPFCPDFPTCQGQWWPEQMSLPDALWPEPPPTALDYEGGTMSAQARTAIHLVHRIGAVITLLSAGLLALGLWRSPAARGIGLVVAGAATLQFVIGAANVLMHFPLPVAVAHSGGALLLLLALVYANLTLKTEPLSAPAASWSAKQLAIISQGE